MKNVGIYSLPVLSVIAADMVYWNKISVFPSQKRILNELAEKCDIDRCPRTLGRWLAKVISEGLLRRKKRHRKTRKYGWEFRSSLSTITGPGWSALIKAGYFTWDQFRMLKDAANANFRKPKNPRTVFRSSGELTSVGEIVEGLVFDSS